MLAVNGLLSLKELLMLINKGSLSLPKYLIIATCELQIVFSAKEDLLLSKTF